MVCATCSRERSDPVPKTSPCEGCGHHRAYRHPGTGDDRFLCPACHEKAGHLRQQTPSGSAEEDRWCSWCREGHCKKCQELSKLAGCTACRCPHEQPDRSGPSIEDAAREVPCPQCWAYQRRECSVLAGDQKHPLHFKRYARANRKGLISDSELALAAIQVKDSYVVWEEPS